MRPAIQTPPATPDVKTQDALASTPETALESLEPLNTLERSATAVPSIDSFDNLFNLPAPTLNAVTNVSANTLSAGVFNEPLLQGLYGGPNNFNTNLQQLPAQATNQTMFNPFQTFGDSGFQQTMNNSNQLDQHTLLNNITFDWMAALNNNSSAGIQNSTPPFAGDLMLGSNLLENQWPSLPSGPEWPYSNDNFQFEPFGLDTQVWGSPDVCEHGASCTQCFKA